MLAANAQLRAGLRRRASPASRARCRPAPPPTASPPSSASSLLRDADRLEVLRQPARRRPGDALRRGELRHRLEPRPREGRAVGGAVLAQHPRQAPASRSPTSCASTGATTAATTTRATTTRRSMLTAANGLMDGAARRNADACPARASARHKVEAADDFAYHDPVDGSDSDRSGHPGDVRGRLAHRLPAVRHRHGRARRCASISSTTSRRRASSIRRRRPRSPTSSRCREAWPRSRSAPGARRRP